MTFEEYVKFIEEPKHLINPVRDIKIFNSNFLEFFSKTPWYAIPIAYLPMVAYSFMQAQNDIISFCFYAILGIYNWTLIEYVLHRFLFHGEEYWLPANNTAYVAHFLLHGIHHAYPQDRYRLVFPVVPGYFIMFFVLVPLYRAIIPEFMFDAFMGGSFLGYIIYDMIHYFVHHSSPKDGYWKDVKIYHMQHHYKDGKNGYGVSQRFWDIVFNTELKY